MALITPAEQLVALKAAKARGVRKLTMGGESVEYASQKEMNAAIADLEAELGVPRPSRQVYPRFVERS